jgi:hypothetical protein
MTVAHQLTDLILTIGKNSALANTPCAFAAAIRVSTANMMDPKA